MDTFIRILVDLAFLSSGFIVGLIVANTTHSKAEAEIIKRYNAVVYDLNAKVNEARSRVAKRRQLASWSN